MEILFPGIPRFILDAGSGIRELGKELMQSSEPVKAYIFLSHFHWDHIQGLPFFRPAFKPGNHFIIYGCDEPSVDLTKIISMQMDAIYFPVAVEDMRAKIEFRTILEGRYEVEGITVETKFMNHPGYTFGFRFTYQGKSIVYICDNEPFFQKIHAPENGRQGYLGTLEDRFENFVDDKEESLIRFIANSDVFIHDTQYLPEEYEEKVTWGHSPYTYTVDLAVKGRVKHLILFHHDPDHDDETVARIGELSRQRLRDYDYAIRCDPAQEGAVIEL